MDAITSAARSIDIPLLKWIGVAIDDPFVYIALLIALVLATEARNPKRTKIAFSLLLCALAVSGVKQAMSRERPCAGEIWCPNDPSFPSLHAAIAFTLMMAYLNKGTYPLFVVFALFVGFTRMNIGVHIFMDIAGALPMALLSYYATDLLLGGNRRG